jgi:hypothetical protein
MTKQRIKAMILLHHWALLHRWASNAAKRVSPDTKDLRLVKSGTLQHGVENGRMAYMDG